MKRLFVASLALFAAACASTPTGNIAPGSTPTAVSTRLTQEQISTTRYRVSYLGPPSMPIETAKDHALMGAAKLTLDKGSDWFEVADIATGTNKASVEIVIGKGETLAGGKAQQYDASETYSQLRAKLG